MAGQKISQLSARKCCERPSPDRRDKSAAYAPVWSRDRCRARDVGRRGSDNSSAAGEREANLRGAGELAPGDLENPAAEERLLYG